MIRLLGYAALLLCVSAQTSFATIGDNELLQARAAYDRKNVIALSDYAQQLESQNYILAPYANYWLMLLNLEDADSNSVTEFLNNYSEYPFADRLRGEYLKKLAKQQDWASFSSELPNYHLDDAAVACYAAEANSVAGDKNALEAAKTLWLQAKEQPAACNNLYNRMQAENVLTEEDIMARFRLALMDNRLTLAKNIIKRSDHFDSNWFKLLDKAHATPTIVLSKQLASFKTRFGREVNLFALNRIARNSSTQALSAFRSVEHLFQPEDISAFYGRLGLHAAQRHEPEALQWFKLTDNTILSKDQSAWYVRAALLSKNWPAVLGAIAKMEATQMEEAPWRYWKARALKTQQKFAEANAILTKLATERHYYGWLAQDEIENYIAKAPTNYKVSEAEVKEFANILGVQRAEALQRLDLKWEAKTEWVFATQNFDDKQLLAAAEFAARKQWHDLSIITADKTTELHNFALRYPTPYRDLMGPAADEQSVDEAWVYGITRQESRFMHYAKSGVGASGLMQLMPATAKWAAPRAGISNYNRNMIHELDTNIALGTYYMRHTADLMGGQETMATAAYNAGPSRAKKWATTQALEGAIYAEAIPFTETRTYVQRVMANAHLYAQRLGLKTFSLKQRLGIIPANSLSVSSQLSSQSEQELAKPSIE